jgi:NADH:ubiquinone oxidoreductase subunit 5 (subunit L)/multisubunit Na+/H+ antiporter MnhA subunit
LIHSATLVSAGIYLLLRYNILLQYSNIGWYLILIFSSFTSFYGAIIAAFQTDGKKILAYSTISHCGFLMVSILLFNPLITLLYLLGHGLFKSASFMCIGNLIQINNNYQDSRVWGGQLNYFFFEFYTLIFCIINLGGFPFTINFFTKHFLFFSYNYTSIWTLTSYVFLKFAAYSGIFYSFKIILNSFYGIKKNFFKNYLNINWTLNDIFIFKNFFKTNKLFLVFLINLILLGCLISYIYTYIYINLNYINIDNYSNFNLFFKNNYINILINYIFIIIFFEFLKNLILFKIKIKFWNFQNLILLYMYIIYIF